MYCKNCGNALPLEAEFCKNCGTKVKKTAGNIKKNNGSHWLLWWKIGETELNNQINNYYQLNFFKTARGESVILIALSLVLTIVLIAFSVVDLTSIYDVILLTILGIFIGFGHRWAIIGAMLLWTLEKGYQLVSGISGGQGFVGYIAIIWWAIYMHAFWLSYKVEGERKKLKLS